MRVCLLLVLVVATFSAVSVMADVEVAAAEVASLTSKAKAECKNPSQELRAKLFLPNNWMCSRGSPGCSPAWRVPGHIVKHIRYTWHSRFNCRRRGCPASCPNPHPFFITAFDYINNAPHLSTLTTLLELFAADPAYAPTINALKDDFGGTILAPTDQAFAEYTSQMAVTPTTPGVLPFLFELVTYHVIGESLYLSELRPGQCFPTLFRNVNSQDPAEICWGEAAAYSKTLKAAWKAQGRKSWGNADKWRRNAFYFVDEQDGTVPLACADKWVAGGGVIHVVTEVAQPATLFPSLAAAATKNGLTSLAAAVTRAGLLDTLEETISIVFAPTNEAFAALLAALNTTLEQIDLQLLTTVLQYHVCGFANIGARDKAFADGVCTTLLGGDATLTWTPTTVNYAGGKSAKILGIVKTPLSLVIVIDTVLVPSA